MKKNSSIRKWKKTGSLTYSFDKRYDKRNEGSNKQLYFFKKMLKANRKANLLDRYYKL